ncbi:phosphoribulokinase, partial [Bacillus sp. CRN 9]|nr:phosphoribulokinase [Bacillus sp. CRN 9]
MDKIFNDIANLIKTEDRKIIIGISGHGASGKTTFANKLVKFIGHKEVNYINTDPYIIGSNLRKYTVLNYKYKNKNHHYKMTACHPYAHNLSALERDISMIKSGLNFYTIG